MARSELKSSIFALPKYKISFDEKLAKQYSPILYANACNSGDPTALYYRIVFKESTQEICIQYFFYWLEQKCDPTSHKYDYEPIFIYLKKDESDINLIVNGGLGGLGCKLHKNEIRPKTGQKDIIEQHFVEKLSPSPYYPFGKTGLVEFDGCYKRYPLNGNDLQFDGNHPMFGIIACSNVFSGSKDALLGKKFSAPLRKLTDRILKTWYFKHYSTDYDMPFGHDVADPFSFPYIKYKSAKESLPKP